MKQSRFTSEQFIALGQLRLLGQEALSAKHHQPPSSGWTSLHIVIDSIN
jgi:hypothetical protein